MTNEVQEFKILKKKNSDDALELLKRIASQVMPIMRKRGWRITHLCEFFPKNPNLLGTNINRGFKINIRLREHYDDTVFLEYNDLLGTMLHELVHIVRGPHDATFYKLLEELNYELDELLISGQTDYRPAAGGGHRLGGMVAATSISDAKRRALEAAERRRQVQKIMLPSGGVKLGGRGSHNALEVTLAPGCMAAYAAEQRLKDQKWCGSLQEQNDNDRKIDDGSNSNTTNSVDEPASNKVIFISSDDDDDSDKQTNTTVSDLQRRRQRQRSPSDEKYGPPKKRVLPTAATMPGWTCAACTFENDDLVLTCTMCLSERPYSRSTVADDSSSLWSCQRCTLLNEYAFVACAACGLEKNSVILSS